MFNQKELVLTKENCKTKKPTNVQLNPGIRDVLSEMSEETGEPMFLIVNIAIRHLKNSMTKDVVKRLNDGESLARIFDVRGIKQS